MSTCLAGWFASWGLKIPITQSPRGGVTKYSELEGTHKDHKGQYLVIEPTGIEPTTLALLTPSSDSWADLGDWEQMAWSEKQRRF